MPIIYGVRDKVLNAYTGLVDIHFVKKIADFGLSEDVYANNYIIIIRLSLELSCIPPSLRFINNYIVCKVDGVFKIVQDPTSLV